MTFMRLTTPNRLRRTDSGDEAVREVLPFVIARFQMVPVQVVELREGR